MTDQLVSGRSARDSEQPAGQAAGRGSGRAGGKSADAFRTISEVSDDLEVPQHVLRFWESKFGQVKPLKRGGGRRYYRPNDIELLRRIRDLLYREGYTIKGVQKLLRESRSEPASAPAGGPKETDLEADVRRELTGLRKELVSLRDLLRAAADG